MKSHELRSLMTLDSDKVIRVDGQSSFKLDSQTELTRIRSY